MPDFSLCRLNERELADAYPLVRTATRVTAERWQAFGSALIAAGGGAVAARAGDGCLHGLAIFRPLDSLRHLRCLHVELLVAFALTRRSPVHRLLCTALDQVARELACPSILLTVPAGRSSGRTSRREPGLHMETIGFVRQLSDAPLQKAMK